MLILTQAHRANVGLIFKNNITENYIAIAKESGLEKYHTLEWNSKENIATDVITELYELIYKRTKLDSYQ